MGAPGLYFFCLRIKSKSPNEGDEIKCFKNGRAHALFFLPSHFLPSAVKEVN